MSPPPAVQAHPALCPLPYASPAPPNRSPHLDATPFTRPPTLPFAPPSPDLTCSGGGWPSVVVAATEMNLTPVLHHVDGPAPRPCRAAIPEPGPCAGEGLDAGGDSGSGSGSDTARTCVDY